MSNRHRILVIHRPGFGQVLGTPALFIDGTVHRGGYDPPSLPAVLTS